MKTVCKAQPIETIDSENRSFIVVASDETADRYGDIVTVSGWQLDNFQKNPIALWGHNSDLPIGTVPRVWKDGTRLLAEMKLAPPGVDDFTDKLWRFVEAKILRAVSVQFLPTVEPEPIYNEKRHFTGYKYVGHELLELSLVSVPANAAALTLAKSLLPDDEKTIRRVLIEQDKTLERLAASMRKRIAAAS